MVLEMGLEVGLEVYGNEPDMLVVFCRVSVPLMDETRNGLGVVMVLKYIGCSSTVYWK